MSDSCEPADRHRSTRGESEGRRAPEPVSETCGDGSGLGGPVGRRAEDCTRLGEMLSGNGQEVRLAEVSDRLEAKVLDSVAAGLFAVAGLVLVVAVWVNSEMNDLRWPGSGGEDNFLVSAAGLAASIGLFGAWACMRHWRSGCRARRGASGSGASRSSIATAAAGPARSGRWSAPLCPRGLV